MQPPANPHQIKLLISQSQTASVPNNAEPIAQPKAKQPILIPTIWLLLMTSPITDD